MNGLRMVEQRIFRVLATVLAMAALLWLPWSNVLADEKNGELEIYFIDVEGRHVAGDTRRGIDSHRFGLS